MSREKSAPANSDQPFSVSVRPPWFIIISVLLLNRISSCGHLFMSSA